MKRKCEQENLVQEECIKESEELTNSEKQFQERIRERSKEQKRENVTTNDLSDAIVIASSSSGFWFRYE